MGEFLPEGTLKVKKVGIFEGIPGFLQRKHFWIYDSRLDHDSRLDQYNARNASV